MSTGQDEILLSGRDSLELLAAQVAAIDAWHRARRAAEAAAESAALSRELRLDLSRRAAARRREQSALEARAEQQLREAGTVLAGRARVRAVLAHRNAWLRTAVARRLESQGVLVVGEFEDGADAAGTVVVEQPDLVLVEDRLPTVSGLEVVQRVRSFAAAAVVGAQCLDADGIQPMADAGAQVVVTRQVPPGEIADLLVRCLVTGERPVPVG